MEHIDLTQLTIEERLRLICGKDFWHTCDFDGKIPNVRVSDASMGVRIPINPDKWEGDKPSVAYPSIQVLANSWDKELVREYAMCVADDCLDFDVDILLGPGINIKRSPMCGRNFEYFSEDPYLAGTLAKEYVDSLQKAGIGACIKHFCCNNSEYNRWLQSSDVDERALREIYYKPFEIVCEAKPFCVMSSYNRINGVFASEYKKGYDVLRNEYGFDGLIMSDWEAVRNRTAACKAGLDLEMPYDAEHYESLVADYKAGKISEEEINQCAQRVLDLAYRCHELKKNKKATHTQNERIAFTQKAEEEGIVMLKNDGVLPLKKGQSIAMCGLFANPDAKPERRDELMRGGGSGAVARITPMFNIPAIMQQQFGGKVLYDAAFMENGWVEKYMNPGFAMDHAAECDVNIVFAGTGGYVESEGSDRNTLKLGEASVRTILSTAAVNKNTVVVLFAGAPIDMSEWIDKVAAVIYAGFPGERGGEAIVNVLTGKVNPCGKLSETFPLTYEDTPFANSYMDCKVTCYEEGIKVGYRYYDTYHKQVLFPFGHGLSYSTFVYQNLSLEKVGDCALKVHYEIKNDSQTDGKEISQVYIRSCGSYVERPNKELKGFAKTLIQAGSVKEIEVSLDCRAFEYWSTAKDCWDIEDGIYEIVVCASATDEKLSAKVKIKNGNLTLL